MDATTAAGTGQAMDAACQAKFTPYSKYIIILTGFQ
jgi:hypothetical protein